ncbi:hypothetical protein C3492_11630 [Streptomyces sp. Ru62]|uniref:hypothetical protein n=1 Tax=Streptomyces sp. Ru62 TaxID=2080745 RepID=UPI000CDD046C|nr:hypothetical protein [Streptomyces sp. Ru62]POX63310.1 hypothetical protein C3492_11630 [Streptomyces sp. Ru62]
MPELRLAVAAAVATLSLGVLAATGAHLAHPAPTAVAAQGQPATATTEQPAGTAMTTDDMIWQ